MRNKGKIIGLFLLLIFLLTLLPVNAQKNNLTNKKEIPEIDGTYDDPDHPGVKVRVFVYKPKPEFKPSKRLSPTPTPTKICDLEDPDSSYLITKEKWRLPVEWSYNLNTESVPPTVGKNNLEQIAFNSFNRWSDATKKIIFKKGENTRINRQALDYLNIVTWGKTQRSALAVTYIRYFPDNGAVVDIDTIMNSKLLWRWANSTNCAYPDAYDAENILTHEAGHWIGLGDMYEINYQQATMYGYGALAEVKKITLTEGDKQSAYQIYLP